MDRYSIYKDISERTQGDIYIGVVGPVRTGKSTFIKRFMELLVLPNIENGFQKERARDELPQSAAGKTIMTTEPKFVPNEAVSIDVGDDTNLKVRLVDCVGYLVDGAMGHLENNLPRMVTTPWFEHQIPFIEAAELGTKKVINEHSTIGLVITTDGSITDIPREGYISAENKVIEELKAIEKPFIVILNSVRPESEEVLELRSQLEDEYKVPVIAANCAQLENEDIELMLEKILMEFPVREIAINIPNWIYGLDAEHWLKNNIINEIKDSMNDIKKFADVRILPGVFEKNENIKKTFVESLFPGEGRAVIQIDLKDHLFYRIIGEETGVDIDNETKLIGFIKSYARIKKEYDRVEVALRDVKEKGYGMVMPTPEDLSLEEPVIVKHGSRFGVRLKASSPSIHLIRADIETEIAPLVGTEKQSEELVNYLMREFEEEPGKIWQSNIFGKSLYELVSEGLYNKLEKMPEDAQLKLQETLQRIINEGSGGLICIIL